MTAGIDLRKKTPGVDECGCGFPSFVLVFWSFKTIERHQLCNLG